MRIVETHLNILSCRLNRRTQQHAGVGRRGPCRPTALRYMPFSGKLMKSLILAIVLFFVCTFTANAEDLNDAGEILKNVESKYQSLKSYSDCGIVETSMEVVSFKTRFIKPELFKFNWSGKIKSDPGIIHNYAIWSSGNNVYRYYPWDNKVETVENLDMAIGGATGISYGAAHSIPSLLGLSTGFKITKISHPILVGESVAEKELCYHIRGKHNKYNDTTYDLFVSKSTFTIRKIIEQINSRIKVVSYNTILLNSDIPISEFNDKQLILKQIIR